MRCRGRLGSKQLAQLMAVCRKEIIQRQVSAAGRKAASRGGRTAHDRPHRDQSADLQKSAVSLQQSSGLPAGVRCTAVKMAHQTLMADLQQKGCLHTVYMMLGALPVPPVQSPWLLERLLAEPVAQG